MNFVLLLLGGFVLGSIPIGYLAARAKGIDITKEGSGNIGATNVVRVLGKGPGLVVFALDVLKGFIPAFTAQRLGYGPEWAFAAGAAAILGHSFSPFLGFKGGKGIATGLGMLMGASPFVGLSAFAVFNVVLGLSLIVSLASCFAAMSMFIFAIAYGDPIGVIIPLFILGLYIVWRHKPNIERLIQKNEPKVGQKPGEPPPDPRKPRLIAFGVALALIAAVVIGMQYS